MFLFQTNVCSDKIYTFVLIAKLLLFQGCFLQIVKM